MHDESLWIRILYNIRHAVWPGGNLNPGLKRKENSYSQRKLLQEEATIQVEQFLPCKLMSTAIAAQYIIIITIST